MTIENLTVGEPEPDPDPRPVVVRSDLERAARTIGTIAVVFATIAAIPMIGVLSAYEFLGLIVPTLPALVAGGLAPRRTAGRVLAMAAIAIVVVAGIYGAISYYTYAGPPGHGGGGGDDGGFVSP